MRCPISRQPRLCLILFFGIGICRCPKPQPWLSKQSALFTDSLGSVVHYPTDPDMPLFLAEGIFAAARTSQDWLVMYPRDGKGGHAYNWTFFDEINGILNKLKGAQ